MARTVQTLAAIVLILAAWFLRGALLLVFAGVVFGVGLYAVAAAIVRLARIPLSVAVWGTVLVTAILCASAGALGGGAVLAQWSELWRSLHVSFANAILEVQRVPAVASVLASVDVGGVLSQTAPVLAGAGGILSGAFGIIVSILVVVFVAVAGALEPQLYRDGFLRLIPVEARAEARSTIDDVVRSLRTWLIARVLSMCVTAILVTVGLSVLRVPLALALGVLAGALAFVPNIGAFVAGAPAVVIAFAIRPQLALAVLVMYWLVHIIDDFVVSPFVERKMVSLPPILTLVAQIGLAAAAGTIGIMLAAPLVLVSTILVQRLWIERLERSLP